MGNNKYKDYSCLGLLIWGGVMFIVLPLVGYSNDFDTKDWVIAVVIMMILLIIFYLKTEN
jgi:hypothetical protein